VFEKNVAQFLNIRIIPLGHESLLGGHRGSFPLRLWPGIRKSIVVTSQTLGGPLSYPT
jgi:hypothetical protein